MKTIAINSQPSRVARPLSHRSLFRAPQSAASATALNLQSCHACALSSSRSWVLLPLPPCRRQAVGLQRRFRSLAAGLKVEAASVDVTFVLPSETSFGESYKLVGDRGRLGNWNPDNGAAMKWNDGHIWRVTVPLSPGDVVEFKCVFVSEGGVKWEGGNNRSFKVPQSGPVSVEMTWSETEGMNVDGSCLGSDNKGEENHEWKAEVTSSLAGSMDASRSSSDDVSGQWEGGDVEFMTENRHSRERTGVWNTEGLEGAALAVVKGDKEAGSWLQKLQVVKSLLCDDADRRRPQLDALVNASAYLQWINTGAIRCVEGGGHYRPNKHAELSREIFRSLEWTVGDQNRTLTEKLVARRLHLRLPSFSAEFTASVPLTRIRDIAHRSDIPHDLKREIKHTLQNKLHRNAGPEDLVATEEMLRRITRNPGEYNEDFVSEFKIFFEELKDFFNANSLAELLHDMGPSLDTAQQNIVSTFLNAKAKVDSSMPAPKLQEVMEALHCLTSVRALLTSQLASGMRNDAPDESIAMRQTWRLAEIKTEDYAFVLLSAIENSLENSGGYSVLSSSRDRDWALPIGATVLGLRHMALSGWKPVECTAIEMELEEWQRQGFLSEPTQALRLKAALERCLRVTEDYASMLLEAFPARVAALGSALGIDERLRGVFTEAEIRAGVVFQLSKLATLLCRAARTASGSSSWDVVVSGQAKGRLVEVDSFDPLAVAELASREDIVLLVKTATGDEEVAGVAHLQGIILQQDIPHLSHLGVRSRQEKIVFVTSEDKAAIDGLRSLIGKTIQLNAGAEGVQVQEATGASQVRPRAKIAEALSKGSKAGASGGSPSGKVVIETPVKGIEIMKDEKSSGRGIDILTFSFRQEKVEQVMSDEELLALMESRKEKEAARASAGNGNAEEGESEQASVEAVAAFQEAQKASRQELIPLASATQDRCGAKAAACSQLLQAAKASGGAFEAPGGVVLPFGVMDIALTEAGLKGRFDELLGAIETAEVGEALNAACEELQSLVVSVRPSEALVREAERMIPEGSATIARSSANVEDLAGMSGAGLYNSVPNRGPSDPEDFGNAVAQVWASLYTRRAVLARRAAGITQTQASMAVLVMPLLEPDASFVLHTARPMDRDSGFLYAEVAPGQGELLASGGRGTPWRLAVDKSTGEVETVAFANFSDAMWVRNGRLEKKVVVYARQPLSCDSDAREALGKRLMEVGVSLEKMFGDAQDVEGALVGNSLYVVQSRPQP